MMENRQSISLRNTIQFKILFLCIYCLKIASRDKFISTFEDGTGVCKSCGISKDNKSGGQS